MGYNEAGHGELANMAALNQMTTGEWVSEGIGRFLKGQDRPEMEAYHRPGG